MQQLENVTRGAVWRGIGGTRSAAVAVLLVLAAYPVAAAPKPEDEPLLKPVDKAHCLALYDAVELRLKGKGDAVASITTRNGLKDFFVVTPGTVDCTGQREVPWRDDKDRGFIDEVLKATGAAQKPPVDLAKAYGIAPAPRATAPRL